MRGERDELICPDFMKNKYNYVLNHFKLIYNLPSKVSISYGIDGQSDVQINIGLIEFFQKSDEKLNTSNLIWKHWEGVKIPFLFDLEDNEIFSIINNQVIINFDIIASSFFLLSGWQEIVCQEKDLYNRFSFYKSIQHELDIIKLPVVNYYFDILKTAIRIACNTNLTRRIISDSDFITFVSHDIDNCENAWLQASFREFLKGNLFAPIKLLAKKISGQDAWFNFHDIIEIEKSLDIKSTFFFIGDNKKNYKENKSDYRISDSKFQKVFSQIEDNGFEIGIHGGIGTHNNIRQFREELRNLDKSVIGNRFHLLKFLMEETPSLLEQSDIRYDSSLGFADHFGFRNSFCFPFYLYDIKNDRSTSVLEIPLNLMDTTFRIYMDLSPKELLSELESLIREIKKHNGYFSINWHNTNLSDYKYKKWKEMFFSILQLVRENNSSFRTGKEIFEQFNKLNRF